MGKKAEARISLRVLQNFKENLQGLQLKIERGMGASGGKVLLITSTSTAEGKSTLAMNLAYTAAEHGKRVLLVDGDLRKQDSRLLLTDQPAAAWRRCWLGMSPWRKRWGSRRRGILVPLRQQGRTPPLSPFEPGQSGGGVPEDEGTV